MSLTFQGIFRIQTRRDIHKITMYEYFNLNNSNAGNGPNKLQFVFIILPSTSKFSVLKDVQVGLTKKLQNVLKTIEKLVPVAIPIGFEIIYSRKVNPRLSTYSNCEAFYSLSPNMLRPWFPLFFLGFWVGENPNFQWKSTCKSSSELPCGLFGLPGG